jgi:hypothetical protein
MIRAGAGGLRLTLVVLVVAFPARLLAQADDEPAKTRAEIEVLIARLSEPDSRERATRELLAKGEKITPLLEERVEKTKDPELRSRLRGVLRLLPFAADARNAGVEVETYVRCRKLIDALTTPSAPEAVAALLERSEEYFPILVSGLDDFRPMGVDGVSFVAGPGAPEGLLHYGPEKVVDCITIVLSMTSDQGFDSLHNGGTDEKRRKVIRKWKDWYGKAKSFVLWDPAKRRYLVDDEAWITEIPVDEYRRLPKRRQSEKLAKAFKRRDRIFQELAGITPTPPEGELKTLIDALRGDPYRPPSFDAPPSVSAAMRKLAARGAGILPAMAHTYHRTFDRSLAISIIATLGELGGEPATKTLKAWMAFEHRQYPRYTIVRTLAKTR